MFPIMKYLLVCDLTNNVKQLIICGDTKKRRVPLEVSEICQIHTFYCPELGFYVKEPFQS